MQCLGRMCVTECFLPLIVENLLLRDRVERISIELLPLLLYTVYIYTITRPFPVIDIGGPNSEWVLIPMMGLFTVKYH